MAGLSTLVDTFEDGTVNATLWPTQYGTAVTETGGRLRMTCDTTYAGVASDTIYTLDSFTAEPFPPALNSAPADCYATVMAKSAAQPDGTTVGYFIDRITGNMYCVIWSGYSDAGAVTITYNATNHAFLHFTYNGTTFVWQSSLTLTGTRTTLRTASGGTLPAWRSNSDFQIFFDTHRDGGTGNFYEVGSFNSSEVHTTTGTGRATAVGTSASSKLATTTGSGRATALGTSTRTTLRTTVGTGRALAGASGVSVKQVATTGTARALAGASATRTTTRTTVGTARAIATASTVVAGGTSPVRVREGGDWVEAVPKVYQSGSWVAPVVKAYLSGTWETL